MLKRILFLSLFAANAFSQTVGLRFDATSNYIDLGAATPIGTKSIFTMECWIKLDDLTNVQGQNPIYGEYTNTTTGGLTANYLFVNDEGKLIFDQYLPPQSSLISNTALTINKWYHIAYVKNGTTEQLFINGTLDMTRIGAVEPVEQREFAHIGARTGAGATPRYFKGTIDEFRIWNIARTQQEIQVSMKSELFDSSPNLELYLKLNEGSRAANNSALSDTLIDETSKHTATLINFTKTGLSSNWFRGAPLRMYVKPVGTGTQKGGTWENAYGNLQSALSLGIAGQEIWVSKGVYNPSGINRNQSFTIPDSVKVFGGFDGTENIDFDLANRKIFLNETILSGDIGIQGDSLDNSYHVVQTLNVSKETLLDGFTIRDGNADFLGTHFVELLGGGWYNEASGTGMVSNPTVRNCIFENNYADNHGGGMASFGTLFGEAGAIVENCIFRGNRAKFSGGGLYIDELTDNTEISIRNTAFTGNRAGNTGTPGYGGGLSVGSKASNLNLEIINCSFVSNLANFGGGIRATRKGGIFQVTLKNTLATSNIGIIYDVTDIKNAILLENGATSQFDHSFVQNNTDISNGNILGTQDPFVLYAPDAFLSPNLSVDFKLTFCSPLVNAGNVSGAPLQDIFGKPRVGNPDIGAFELITSPSSIIYVDRNAANSGSGGSWADAFHTIQEALHLRTVCSPINTIWVAEGTYFPTNSTNRNISFEIPDSVRLFGGFSGIEAANYDLDLRDFIANPTILSGNINNPNDSTDNSFHVVRLSNVGRETLIDGFTITHGHATGAAFTDQLDGAGIYLDGRSGNFSSPTIRNCLIENNYARTGAGIFSNGFEGVASPLIENCSFLNNKVSFDGAGITNSGVQGGASNTVIKNSFFKGNKADGRGAGISNSCFGGNCSFEVIGTVFSGNVSSLGGTGIHNSSDMNLQVTNCTFAGNYSETFAAGIESNQVLINNSIQIQNCIFWKNFSGNNTGIKVHVENYDSMDDISYSMFDGVNSTNNNNLPSVNPMFLQGIEPSSTPSILGDFSLKLCSSVADKGNNASIGTGYTLDIAKKPRIINTTNAASALVDLGAYEFQGASFPNTLLITSDIDFDTIEGSTGTLEASSTVLNPNKVVFNAENHILLKPGFEVQNGAVFAAKVGSFSCPE